MNGRLRLRAGLRDGRTVLLESQGSYPLQVMRPQVDASGGLSLVVLLLSAGLLDGDELAIDVTVEPGARLALRTQAATQVHVGRSCQTVQAKVGEGAWLSYLPRALVPHAGAEFHGRTNVEMRAGARVLLGEPLAPGRALSGEEFVYCQVRLDLDVWCTIRLLARERALIRPDPAVRAAQFGSATHTASVYQLGPGQPPVPEGGPAMVGSTSLARDGWHVRVMANRAADLDQVLDRLAARWWCFENESYDLHNNRL